MGGCQCEVFMIIFLVQSHQSSPSDSVFSIYVDSLMILFSVLTRLKHEYILYEYVRTRLDTQYRHCRIAGRGHATIDR